jgi:predicted RNA-binding Zn-ribbon protein involved in translation (DUF1610 family)
MSEPKSCTISVEPMVAAQNEEVGRKPELLCPTCGTLMPNIVWRWDIYQVWYVCMACGRPIKPALRGNNGLPITES